MPESIARKPGGAGSLRGMSPRELSQKRIRELQRAFVGERDDAGPIGPGERLLLEEFCRAVLASIDVRDLRDTSTQALIDRLSLLLETVHHRADGEVVGHAHVDGESVVLQCSMDDQPFLVSAVRALIRSEGLELKSMINAVITVERDADGKVLGFGRGKLESIIRAEASVGEIALRPGLQERLLERLRLAQAMVWDFEAMKRTIGEVAEGLEAAGKVVSPERQVFLSETEDLMRWLCDENFVLFSVETFDASVGLTAKHGIARLRETLADRALLQRVCSGEERRVRYQRSPHESPVHRSGKPGYFVLPRYDGSGECVGGCVVEGLFTYKALHTPPEEVPSLRVSLREMLAESNVSDTSHRGKNITNAFNSLPLEYLLSESREQVWELTDRVLRAEEEGGSDVHIQVGDDRRFAFVFVALPRAQFSEDLRLGVQKLLLSKFDANYSDYGVYMDRDENAIVHFYISGVRPLPEVDTEGLREEVLGHARSWNQRLRAALGQLVSSDEAEVLFSDYVDAFNEEHMRRAGGERLVGDLACLERLRKGLELDCDLFASQTGDHPGSLNLRVFSRAPLSLSRQLPVISGFGFEVIDEYTREVRLPHMPPVGVHTFRLGVRRRDQSRILEGRHRIVAGLRGVFAGELGDDRLNQLVVTSELSATEVQILRAYVDYVHQLRAPFATELVRDVLSENPRVAKAMMGFASAQFDPAGDGQFEPAQRQLDAELRDVTDFTADRVLRSLAEIVRATVRTNAFVRGRNPGSALAFKIDGGRVSFGPNPKPYREIWVHHPSFQGVHLRGGKVARGGLRFSDRTDDFRTEIHGLMATQMVKNVLIVPMGAKGGFVLRNPPRDAGELRQAGDATYQRFISALLSVTDNVVDGEVVTPIDIVHTEGDDPYLVVAADKGTAHLSDTANRISHDSNFWLDDAFASGGSFGYDHKKTGITARGAWEATKRSFRELGIDPESDVITAIGVGDMSGDVFGNGLLRSRSIKLQAAFNHLHIFIDPDPDPAASFEERKRLFELPRSQWADYARDKLSEGGGIWPRRAKEVALPAPAAILLGFSVDDRPSGEEVIRAIMRLQVDLFWMGGIGTYVKGADESNVDVGDKANDGVRIDARELRCRVFAEGANLAITDKGRVEFAYRGGDNYTAFLDNSGGVDVSDHEVNIKILFAPLLAEGAITREQRNRCLEEVEDEVCEMVLANNRSQSRMVSYDVCCSVADVWRYSRAQDYLAQAVPFTPEAFSMPTADDLGVRARKGLGMFKCEAAVLASHAKMLAYRELLADEPLPEHLVQSLVAEYFPARVSELAGESALNRHLLRREIATTMAVNTILDNAGASFFTEMISITGRKTRDIVLAYMVALDIGGGRELLASLHALEDKHRQGAVYDALANVQESLDDACFHLLGPIAGDGFVSVDSEDAKAAKAMLVNVEEWLPDQWCHRFRRRVRTLVESGIPEDIASRIESMAYLPVVLDASTLVQLIGERNLRATLRLRLEVASAMKLPELRDAITAMALESPWDGPAVTMLSRQLEVHVHKLVRLVTGEEGVDEMLGRCGLNGLRDQVSTLLSSEVSIAALVMLDGQLRRLLPHGGDMVSDSPAPLRAATAS